jgi:Helicase associated domain
MKSQQDAPPKVGKGTRGRLTPDRIKRLEDIGFVWSVRDDWNKHYEDLKLFQKENGHCNVPARHSNRRLGVWVASQRQLYKLYTGVSKSKRQTNPLTKNRIDKLNALNFTWVIRSSSDVPRDGWNRRITEFKEFKQTYGHCLIPSCFAANPELGMFADSLRKNINIFTSAKQDGRTLPDSFPMTDNRLQQLAELGFLEENTVERDGEAADRHFGYGDVYATTNSGLDSTNSFVNESASISQASL